MKEFDFGNYKGRYAMHCKTEEEAKEFCKVMHEAGRKWSRKRQTATKGAGPRADE